MSDSIKRPRNDVIWAANNICDLLRPVCTRIEIAGSLRREKSEVGDIEICAIPTYSTDLFGDQFYSAAVIGEVLRSAGFEMDKDGENYKKFFYVAAQIWIDLFLTTPEQWGLIFMIRTGSADFSRMMMTNKQQGGYMPSNLKVSGGRVWIGNQVMVTPEEKDVFKLWGMEFVEPKNRRW
jgi:DNA polymerase/3'-5' exonuclease PolX